MSSELPPSSAPPPSLPAPSPALQLTIVALLSLGALAALLSRFRPRADADASAVVAAALVCALGFIGELW
ncbi:MAG: hypothetical protein LC659_07555, partial [Myxococcales bacterium]|nr:hypothetical protein [Myxococcales bacterium]